MKNIFKLSFIVLAVLFLTACADDNPTNITAEYAVVEDSLQTDSVEIQLTITDDDSEITGNIIVELLDRNGNRVSGPTSYASVEDASLLVFRTLNPDSRYTVSTSVTVGRTALQLEDFSFTTLAETDLEIKTVEDFLAMSENRGGDYILMNDIDFTGVNFVTPFTSAFTGSFDGQGFTLSNITITGSRLYNGVFGYTSSASIKDLTLDGVSIGTAETPITTSSSTKTGILVGYQSSSLSIIENITIKNSNIYLTSGSATYAYVGLVAGESRGTITNVEVSNGSVQLKTTSFGRVRLAGAIGYAFESAVHHSFNIDVDVSYALEAIESTSDSRSFEIYVGGLFGIVDPASTSNGILAGMYYEGDVSVSSLDFNPSEDHDGVYSVFVGGLFGAVNRGFHNIYMNADMTLNYAEETTITNVDQFIRVGGIAAGLNSYDMPYSIYVEALQITLTIDNEVNTRLSKGIARFNGEFDIYASQQATFSLNGEAINEDELFMIEPEYSEVITDAYLLEVLGL